MLQQDHRPSWADDADAADTRPASSSAATGSGATATAAQDGPPPGFEHVRPDEHAEQLTRGLAGVQARDVFRSRTIGRHLLTAVCRLCCRLSTWSVKHEGNLRGARSHGFRGTRRCPMGRRQMSRTRPWQTVAAKAS